jgi:hypothetical protein
VQRLGWQLTETNSGIWLRWQNFRIARPRRRYLNRLGFAHRIS